MTKDGSCMVDDAEIVTLLRAGSEEGVHQLLRTHGRRIKWLLKEKYGEVLADLDVAAVLNETVLKVFTLIGRFDSARGRLDRWVWQIATNIARDMLRSEMKHAHDSLQYDPAEQESPAESPEEEASLSGQVLQDLPEAIRDLPDLQRKIIKADLASGGLAGASWLATRLATTEGSIYVSRSKARDSLRKAMMRQGHFQD